MTRLAKRPPIISKQTYRLKNVSENYSDRSDTLCNLFEDAFFSRDDADNITLQIGTQ